MQITVCDFCQKHLREVDKHLKYSVFIQSRDCPINQVDICVHCLDVFKEKVKERRKNENIPDKR